MDTIYNFSTLWLSALAVAGGLTLLVAGGDLLISGAVRLARRLGMSALLIGLTVVAFGTSMPEMFVSLAAISKGYTDLMAGNVVGSNIANVGLVLALSALLYPLRIKFSSVSTELYLLMAASLALVVIAWVGIFYRAVGIIFISGLLFYTFTAYRTANKKKKEQNNSQKSGIAGTSWFVIGGLLVGGLLLLAAGSEFFIKGAVDVARYFGISELIIGLTLAAIGTSLPELASSISAIRQRQTSLLVGNVIGSNLFNLMMVMGVTAIVVPFPLSADLLLRDLPVMIAFSAVLLPIIYYRQVVTRLHGFLLLAAYAAYMFVLTIKIS